MGVLSLSFFRRWRKKKKPPRLPRLEKKLKYKFRDTRLLHIALTHRSVDHNADYNYERLEFLGDAVIDHVLSRWLYETYPKEDEGFLTQRRSALVNRKFLHKMGVDLGIVEFIKTDVSVNLRDNKVAINIVGDIFESITGAIYLDGGIVPVQRLIKNTLINNEPQADYDFNFKGQLIEYCHQNNLQGPHFRTKFVRGPEHNKTFTIETIVGDNIIFVGSAKSKKEAEQNSAKNALKDLEEF